MMEFRLSTVRARSSSSTNQPRHLLFPLRIDPLCDVLWKRAMVPSHYSWSKGGDMDNHWGGDRTNGMPEECC